MLPFLMLVDEEKKAWKNSQQWYGKIRGCLVAFGTKLQTKTWKPNYFVFWK
jgi:hypothetical protein